MNVLHTTLHCVPRRPEMRMVLLTLCSTLLSAAVVCNAYYKKQQFYLTVVYLLNSNKTIGVLYLQAFIFVWLACKFVKKLFFGALRASEIEHLIESSWYAVLETFILLAAFHQELNVIFVAMITTLFILKSFHWLAGDRIDYMERSPVITWVFHLRAIALCILLVTLDVCFIRSSWHSLITRGPSVEIVFGLEFAIMLISAVNTFLRYCLHCLDLQNETPWQNKTIYLRYIDIVLGFLKLCIYVGYMAFMLWILFIPLHIARRIYITAKNFQKNLHDVVLSRQAIYNLNTLYPDATAEELSSGNNVCIICREEMALDCKKLPCTHIFHTVCLRSWFQEQQSCPTCRMDILQNRPPAATGANQPQRRRRPQQQPREGGAAEPARGRGGQHGVVAPPGMFPGMMPPMWPHPPPPHQPHPQPPANTAAAAAAAAGGGGEQRGGVGGNDQPDQLQQDGGSVGQAPPQASVPPPPPSPPPHPMMMPGMSQAMPPFFMPPFFPPFPPMPPFGGGGLRSGGEGEEAWLRGLTEEELKSLEGMERANVEARIQVLRRVQTLLDAAVMQLNQYSTVMATLGSTAGPGFPGYSPPPPPPPFNTAAATNPQAPMNDTTTTNAPAESQRLFHSTASSNSSSKTGGQALLQSPPSCTFSAPSVQAQGDEKKTLGTEETLGKTTDGAASKSEENAVLEPQLEREQSDTWTDDSDVGLTFDTDRQEVRQRRLQRFNSLPASPTSHKQQGHALEATEGNSQDQTDDV